MSDLCLSSPPPLFLFLARTPCEVVYYDDDDDDVVIVAVVVVVIGLSIHRLCERRCGCGCIREPLFLSLSLSLPSSR